LNVIINYQCNCSCDYCFAKPFSSSDCSVNMEIKEFKKILRFLKKSGFSFIHIFGGEPTLHPDFIKLVSYADKLFRHFFVLTNGFIEKKITDQLTGFSSARYVCNYTARKFSTSPQTNLDYFLKTLSRYITLGVTYSGDLSSEEIDSWIKTINRYNLKRVLRFGIASPDCERSNKYLDFNEEKKEFNEHLQLISTKLFKEGIVLAEDCTSVPLCKLDNNTIALWKRNFGKDIMTYCAPPSDYMPGKMVSSCFGTATFLVPFSRYKTSQEFQAYFMRLHKLLENNIIIEPCSKCNYFRVSCFGGCLNNFISQLKPLVLKNYAKPEIDNQKWLTYCDDEKTFIIKKDDIDKHFIFKGIEKMFFDLLIKEPNDIELIKEDSPKNVADAYNYIIDQCRQ
jgi:hypothetical protein